MPGGPCGVQPKTEASQGVSQEKAAAGKSDALRPESAEAPGVESAEGAFAALLVGRAEGGLSVGQSQPVARSSMRTAQLQKPPAPSRPIHALQESRSDLIPRQTERETLPGRQCEGLGEQRERGGKASKQSSSWRAEDERRQREGGGAETRETAESLQPLFFKPHAREADFCRGGGQHARTNKEELARREAHEEGTQAERGALRSAHDG